MTAIGPSSGRSPMRRPVVVESGVEALAVPEVGAGLRAQVVGVAVVAADAVRGLRWAGWEESPFDAVHDRGQDEVEPFEHGIGQRVPDDPAAVGEEPVAGLDIGVRSRQAFSGCESVERQLEVLAIGIGQVLADLVVVLLLPGLEVGDDQSAADGPVDAVDAPTEPECATVGEAEDKGLVAVEPECHLGRDRGEEVVAAPLVVVEKELLEVPPQSASVALPQEGTSGEAPGLDQGELLVADAVEAQVVIWPPGSRVRGEVVGLDRLGEEPVQDLVGE